MYYEAPQPQWHYEQIFIRHIDGHEGDETDEDPEANFVIGMTLAEYEMAIKV